MKKYLVSILLTLSISSSFGQWLDDENYKMTFDDSIGLNHIFIDTISNPNNIWQIGKPQKNIFTSAYSNFNAIVSDTINSYPINDTSVFIIKNTSCQGLPLHHTTILSCKYSVNSDTLNDFGKIEVSFDNQLTWINLLMDTLIQNDSYFQTLEYKWEYFGEDKPILSGNSEGWKNAWINIAQFGYYFNFGWCDTVVYRFTFISDSIQTNKDGLMFDDFEFIDYAESINNLQKNEIISIFPNPVSNELTIESTENLSFEISNSIGQIMQKGNLLENNKVNTNNYKSGIYFVKFENGRVLKFVKM